MSYTQTPAAKLLFVRCSICERPLLDSLSVESGIGPICRAMVGYDPTALPQKKREEANRIVARIPTEFDDGKALIKDLNRLWEFGFDKLAQRLADRLVARRHTVRVTTDGDFFFLSVPYNPVFNETLKSTVRALGGRALWNPHSKKWEVPIRARIALEAVMEQYFASALWCGPFGVCLFEQRQRV